MKKTIVEENLQTVNTKPQKYIDFFGQKMTIYQIAKLYGIRWDALNHVYQLTSNIDEAVSICVNENDCVRGESCKQKIKMQKNTVSIDKLKKLGKDSFPETSLKGNDHTFLNNTVDSVETAENLMLGKEINKVMEMIPPREAKILSMRFGLKDGYSHTLEETAKIFGLSKDRIRQIECKALRTLRHPKRSECLVDYMHEKQESKLQKLIKEITNGSKEI